MGMEGSVVEGSDRPRLEWTYRMAAQKLGMTERAYRARVEAGEKWCTLCRDWHKASLFGRDRSRGDKLTHSCLRSIAESYKEKRGARPALPSGRRAAYRCSVCGETDHTKRRCPKAVRGAA